MRPNVDMLLWELDSNGGVQSELQLARSLREKCTGAMSATGMSAVISRCNERAGVRGRFTVRGAM